jgi:uncharacterized protein (DUF1810 family)
VGSDDPFDLHRFVAAQAPVYERVVAELKRGRKSSHWMWFIFPQAAGLGRSAMSERYAIRSDAEARAFLAHPCPAHASGNAPRWSKPRWRGARRWREYLFGEVDAMKFRSSMKLFRGNGM